LIDQSSAAKAYKTISHRPKTYPFTIGYNLGFAFTYGHIRTFLRDNEWV